MNLNRFGHAAAIIRNLKRQGSILRLDDDTAAGGLAVFVTGGLADVDVSEGWEKYGSEYMLQGAGPLLKSRARRGICGGD